MHHWQHISLKFTLVVSLIKVSALKSLFFCVCPKYPANRIFYKQPTLLQCLPKTVYKDITLKGKASLEINIFMLSLICQCTFKVRHVPNMRSVFVFLLDD